MNISNKQLLAKLVSAADTLDVVEATKVVNELSLRTGYAPPKCPRDIADSAYYIYGLIQESAKQKHSAYRLSISLRDVTGE